MHDCGTDPAGITCSLRTSAIGSIVFPKLNKRSRQAESTPQTIGKSTGGLRGPRGASWSCSTLRNRVGSERLGRHLQISGERCRRDRAAGVPGRDFPAGTACDEAPSACRDAAAFSRKSVAWLEPRLPLHMAHQRSRGSRSRLYAID
jgi:hypothetical protein